MKLRVFLSMATAVAFLGGCDGGSGNAGESDVANIGNDVTAVAETIEEDRDGIVNPGGRVVAVVRAVPAKVRPPGPITAGPRAWESGAFGPLHDWPLIPIATLLMPDGLVLGYGTNSSGTRNGKMNYVVWDPSQGTGAAAFLTLPNSLDTNIFCAGQLLVPATGNALIFGGSTTTGGKTGPTGNVSLFSAESKTLTSQPRSMAYRRWYASTVALPDGEMLVLGGRMDAAENLDLPTATGHYASTPEVRGANGIWRALTAAQSETAYGAEGSSWSYPRAWVDPQGGVFILGFNGHMFRLTVSGTGELTQYATRIPSGPTNRGSVMFAPGRILSLRHGKLAYVVDINPPDAPTATRTDDLAKDRSYSNLTVLADGKVWANGGSSTGNTLAGAWLDSELWDPATGHWAPTASAAQPRLYHSTAMLLPDGTVFTGGGGAPGPLAQLNGEIFYPPYLFRRDGSGSLATRPIVVQAPETLTWNEPFVLTASEPVARVTLVRFGGVTHHFSNETRFLDLPVPVRRNTVEIEAPASRFVAPPGYYLLFAWNVAGVPSLAKVVWIQLPQKGM